MLCPECGQPGLEVTAQDDGVRHYVCQTLDCSVGEYTRTRIISRMQGGNPLGDGSAT
jgi:hypothetical protein